MTSRTVMGVLVATLGAGSAAGAQALLPVPTSVYVDPVNGLSLEEAIARALAQEPSLRASRSQIDVARGKQQQAGLRSNPMASFEQRAEPDGTDSQTTVGVEWPLELFRKRPRVLAAGKEVAAVQSAVADRERLLRAEVRMRYGEVLAAIREVAIVEEVLAATRRQHDLLRSRVEEGATPPLERDLLDVEQRRLHAERLLQSGGADAAVFELKRVLGMTADSVLTVRESLEAVVTREAVPAQIGDPASAIAARSDVREAAARIEVAEATIERVQAEGRLDVSLFGNYMRMDAGFPQMGFTPDGRLARVRGLFHYWTAGATVSVPILNRNQGELAAARSERAGAAAAHEAARLTADAELAAARTRDERAREAVSLYTSGAQALARQNLSVVSQSYDLGRVTVFDVLDEQRRYLDVERSYTATLKAAYEARTALELASGGVR